MEPEKPEGRQWRTRHQSTPRGPLGVPAQRPLTETASGRVYRDEGCPTDSDLRPRVVPDTRATP